MLNKKQKIKRAEFQSVISKGKIFHSPHLTMRVAYISGEKNIPSKFSFVVSGKVARKAVDRNKMKRRGYAVVRGHKNKIKKNYLCAFFFKKGSQKISFKDVEKEITFLLTKAQVLFKK